MVRSSIFSGLGMLICFACVTPNVTTSEPARSRHLIIPETATIDQFGHLYYATSQNRIIKLNENGDSIGYYANNSFGEISLIDVTNPLKVLIYYRDFYSGVVLDRLLNETQVFNMLELGLGEIRVIGSSIDGAMWVFNDHEQRLIKATQNGQVLLRGEDLRLRFNERLVPTKIAQSGESLFLQIPERGLLVFDLFGQFKTQILEEKITDFQMLGNDVVIRNDAEMVRYDPVMHRALETIDILDDGQGKLLWHGNEIIRVNTEKIDRRSLVQ